MEDKTEKLRYWGGLNSIKNVLMEEVIPRTEKSESLGGLASRADRVNTTPLSAEAPATRVTGS